MNTGPGRKTKPERSRSHTDTPVTSDGSRSGVNWMRWNWQWIERASDFASSVLPTPGTSSMSRWPSDNMARTMRSTTSRLPWTTRSMFADMAPKRSANQARSSDASAAVTRSILLLDECGGQGTRPSNFCSCGALRLRSWPVDSCSPCFAIPLCGGKDYAPRVK